MRFLMFIACAGVAFAQSDQDTDSNMSCVERLEMPVYPPLAAAARIRGTVKATVSVSADGSAKTTSEEPAHALLIQAVQNAIVASAFRKSCAGKSVSLVFNFVFGEKPDTDRQRQRISFSYPNQFSISVPPQIIETTP